MQHLAGRSSAAAAVERALEDADRLVLVAEIPGVHGVMGWAQTWHHDRRIDDAPPGHYLAGVTVDPEHRRQGVASTLTADRIQWIRDRAASAWCVVNAANRASIDLHRRFGFSEVLRAPVLTGVTFSGGVGLLLRAELRAVPDPG